MRLIIGGAGQGKLDYALNKTGADPAAVALDPAQAADTPGGLGEGQSGG